MPYKLISLVFLLFILIINKAYTENKFILPVKKPSIFKEIEKKVNLAMDNSLPQKKPKFKFSNSIKLSGKRLIVLVFEICNGAKLFELTDGLELFVLTSGPDLSRPISWLLAHFG